MQWGWGIIYTNLLMMVTLGSELRFELCLHCFNFWEREKRRRNVHFEANMGKRYSLYQVHGSYCWLYRYLFFSIFLNIFSVFHSRKYSIKYMLFYKNQNFLNWNDSKLFKFYLLDFVFLFLICSLYFQITV